MTTHVLVQCFTNILQLPIMMPMTPFLPHFHFRCSVYLICIDFLNLLISSAAPGIFIWGLQPRGSGWQKSSSGGQGQSPSRGCGGPSVRDPEAEAVCRYCLQILTAETTKTWNFCTTDLLILGQYVLQWGEGYAATAFNLLNFHNNLLGSTPATICLLMTAW